MSCAQFIFLGSNIRDGEMGPLSSR